MNWEWVTLILGALTIIACLFGFVAWTTAKTERFKAVPKTLPDMMRSTEKQDV